MSILIKGIEMPKSCAFCRFNGAYCYAKGDEDVHSTLSCPLIEIPPHGRLIDADTLYENCVLDNSTTVLATAKRINEYMQIKIENTPTVIEAEEEE